MFKIDPSEIESLDGLQLVQLLRGLMYAEARKAGVALRNVDVPLQITHADGGRDAIVKWQDGQPSTDYFPGRDIIFQCKATDNGDAQWTKEVWTKPTQHAKSKIRILNTSIAQVLARGGSYIGVTGSALVGDKAEHRAEAIREGVRLAGANPAALASVQVYGANKLADWASAHPAVAQWIKEQKPGGPFAGFATLDQWAKRAEIATPPFVASPAREFSLGSNRADVLDFAQFAARIVDHISDAGACARLWGAAGIGKTRALHQALSISTGTLRELTTASFVFCDFRDVATKIWDVANQIKNEGSPAVLVVDACPFEDSKRLFDLARAQGSKLRVITIGTEGRDQITACLSVRPEPADRETIRGILKAGLPTAKGDELDYIAALCDGFPRIAVLIADSYADQGILKSADDVAEQIIAGAKLGPDTVRALECLSLFDSLVPDDVPTAFDEIAERLAHMSGGMMYEHLIAASEQHLVGRNNQQLAARPRPIADYLAMRRLRYLRTSAVIAFLRAARPEDRTAMLARWRYLARSRTLNDVVRTMLRTDLAAVADLLDPANADYLAPFVHVDPDAIGNALFWAIMQMPLAALATIPVTDGLLDALRLLASRQSSFGPAAQMVLRLAAVADTEGSPPIVALLRQLFQVALAGTQADDRRRREALAAALGEDDPQIRRACVEALGAMLQTYISRSTDFEQVGAEPYAAEWTPADQETIQSYFKWALDRLLEVWRQAPELRATIEEHIAGDMRNLLSPDLLPTIDAFAREVVATSGHWFGATRSIGDWLYYDRPSPDDAFATAVRALYDATLPATPVEQALLYSRFWQADIHDPDKRYADNVEDPDFEYSSRRAQALAPQLARDPAQLARIIAVMSSEEMNSPYPFVEALVAALDDPLAAFRRAAGTLDESGTRAGMTFVRSLLTAIDRRLVGQPGETEKLEQIAASSATLSANPMNIYTALLMNDVRLERLTAQVRAGEIPSAQVVLISYGKGLAHVSAPALADLITALTDRTEDGGAWAALEILSMVTHDTRTLTPELISLTKLAILSPGIAEDSGGNASHAEYVHERMLKLLQAAGAIDETFARAIALQIERACRSVGGRNGRSTDVLRAALPAIVKVAPGEVWAVLAGFYEIATRVERERLNTIISATKAFAYDVSRINPGPLFETPTPLMLDWVAKDPENRIAFLVSFFPVLRQDGDDWTWHPALQQVADLYGSSKRFQAALRARIFPSSWGGSLNAHLTSFKAPLAAWADDASLGDWATGMIEIVDHALADGFHGR